MLPPVDHKASWLYLLRQRKGGKKLWDSLFVNAPSIVLRSSYLTWRSKSNVVEIISERQWHQIFHSRNPSRSLTPSLTLPPFKSFSVYQLTEWLNDWRIENFVQHQKRVKLLFYFLSVCPSRTRQCEIKFWSSLKIIVCAQLFSVYTSCMYRSIIHSMKMTWRWRSCVCVYVCHAHFVELRINYNFLLYLPLQCE